MTRRILGTIVGAAALIMIPNIASAVDCTKAGSIFSCSQCKQNKNFRLSPGQANASCERAMNNRPAKQVPVSGRRG